MSDRLKIAFVTSEAVPFAKTGGLADVSGALPNSLAEMGHQVRLFMPGYRQALQNLSNKTLLDYKINCEINEWTFEANLYYHKKDSGVECYFIDNEFLYDRSALYVDPITKKDYADNDDRFIFFCRAVLESLKLFGWAPNILHCNDWQSALIPTFLKTIYRKDSFYENIRSVFTIHNMGYQGQFPKDVAEKLSLEESLFYAAGPLEYWGDINFMKSAINFADHITTVSPQYADEIQNSNEYGMGLEGVLKGRSKAITGILNGADYDIWSPKKDKLIPFKYFPANLSGKKKNKIELLNRSKLPVRLDDPLIGIISRLDVQKGFDLIEEVIDDIMQLPLQMILLGTGDPKFHKLFADVERKYPDKFKTYLMFDNDLAHLIEAGSDIFLMPSRYEPCGLNQLYSLKYGTAPIVRRTGGLADTVIDYDPMNDTGTGFVFDAYDAKLMLEKIKLAVSLYPKKRKWYKLIKTGMAMDFSWGKSAEQYLNLYKSILPVSELV